MVKGFGCKVIVKLLQSVKWTHSDVANIRLHPRPLVGKVWKIKVAGPREVLQGRKVLSFEDNKGLTNQSLTNQKQKFILNKCFSRF